MTYKNYVGVAEFDDEAGVIRGQVVNIRDVITFQGSTVEEVRQAFRDSVDDYLAFCAERGEDPERPLEAEAPINLGPGVHRTWNPPRF